MSNDVKHNFHLKEYSILQLLYAGTLPYIYIKVSELNTAVLLQMEMELQVPSAWGKKEEKKMGIKKKKTFYANCRSWTLSHFSKMYNYCKSNVSAHQSCTI